jgi:hypothetical protein
LSPNFARRDPQADAAITATFNPGATTPVPALADESQLAVSRVTTNWQDHLTSKAD